MHKDKHVRGSLDLSLLFHHKTVYWPLHLNAIPLLSSEADLWADRRGKSGSEVEAESTCSV